MAKRLFRRIKRGAASAMSAPARARAAHIQAQSGRDAKVIRTARERRTEPPFDEQGRPTKGLKARTLAPQAKQRAQRRTQRMTQPGRVRGAFQRIINLGGR